MRTPLAENLHSRIPGYFMVLSLFCLSILLSCGHSRGQDDIQTGAERTDMYLPMLQGKKLGYHWPILQEPSEQAKVWGVRENDTRER